VIRQNKKTAHDNMHGFLFSMGLLSAG